jgi:hypothetical protein
MENLIDIQEEKGLFNVILVLFILDICFWFGDDFYNRQNKKENLTKIEI